MKALVLEKYNQLVYKDVPDPVPGPDEVLVQVKACGICGSDVHGLDGSTGRRVPPLIMGHEAYFDTDKWRGTWSMEGGGVLVNQSPHQLDLIIWYMGDVEEVYGIWRNLNHPYIEVDDTALAIVKFKSGAIGNILVSNSQKPGIYGKVHVHGQNGASVGVQTDGGAMFIAGMTNITEPPLNDLWTVPGEEHFLEEWKNEDLRFFQTIEPTSYYMQRQVEDFLDAIKNNREPAVIGKDGRKTVELFSAVYRSTRDNAPVRFPLKYEPGFDGREKLII